MTLGTSRFADSCVGCGDPRRLRAGGSMGELRASVASWNITFSTVAHRSRTLLFDGFCLVVALAAHFASLFLIVE